jgi:hypothetical protein
MNISYWWTNYDAVCALYYLPQSYLYKQICPLHGCEEYMAPILSMSFIKRRDAVTIKWPQKILTDSNMCHWLGLKCEQQEVGSWPQSLSNSCKIYSEKPVISSWSPHSSTLEHTHIFQAFNHYYLIHAFPCFRMYYTDLLTCPFSTL